MTIAAYQIVKKALLKKKAEIKASPAAAKRLLVESGLADVLANAPSLNPGKTSAIKKTRGKKVSA